MFLMPDDRCGEVSASEDTLLDILPNAAFVIDQAGCVMRSNRLAQALLGDGEHIAMTECKRLHFAEAKVGAVYAGLISRFYKNGGAYDQQYVAPMMRLELKRVRGSDRAVLIIRMRQGRSGLGAGREPSDVARLLGLSEKKARLANALMNGRRLSDFAKSEGITVHTAKFHLKQLRKLFSCTSQGDLVCKLFNLLGA